MLTALAKVCLIGCTFTTKASEIWGLELQRRLRQKSITKTQKLRKDLVHPKHFLLLKKKE